MQTGIINIYLSQNNYDNSETRVFFRSKMVAKALLDNHTFFKDVKAGL